MTTKLLGPPTELWAVPTPCNCEQGWHATVYLHGIDQQLRGHWFRQPFADKDAKNLFEVADDDMPLTSVLLDANSLYFAACVETGDDPLGFSNVNDKVLTEQHRVIEFALTVEEFTPRTEVTRMLIADTWYRMDSDEKPPKEAALFCKIAERLLVGLPSLDEVKRRFGALYSATPEPMRREVFINDPGWLDSPDGSVTQVHFDVYQEVPRPADEVRAEVKEAAVHKLASIERDRQKLARGELPERSDGCVAFEVTPMSGQEVEA